MPAYDAIRTKAEELLRAALYDCAAGDEVLLQLCARHAGMEILSSCNLVQLPEGLLDCAARLCVAEFIRSKKGSGGLDGFAGIDLGPALKSIQEGDTSISYDTAGAMSPEQRLEQWLTALESCRAQLIAYRRLAW